VIRNLIKLAKEKKGAIRRFLLPRAKEGKSSSAGHGGSSLLLSRGVEKKKVGGILSIQNFRGNLRYSRPVKEGVISATSSREKGGKISILLSALASREGEKIYLLYPLQEKSLCSRGRRGRVKETQFQVTTGGRGGGGAYSLFQIPSFTEGKRRQKREQKGTLSAAKGKKSFRHSGEARYCHFLKRGNEGKGWTKGHSQGRGDSRRGERGKLPIPARGGGLNSFPLAVGGEKKGGGRVDHFPYSGRRRRRTLRN